MNNYTGPFDVAPFPDRLDASVVTAEVAPRVQGYPLLTDLAHAVGFTDTVWLALKGELPTVREKWIFEKALYWLSPVNVGEAPTHSAILSRICGSWTSATTMVGAIGLAERSRALQNELAPWMEFLKRHHVQTLTREEIPCVALDTSHDSNLELARTQLFQEFEKLFGPSILFDSELNYRREAVALLLLDQIDCLDNLVVDFLSLWAALPLVIAEVKHVNAGDTNSYPGRIPEIQYVEFESN